MSVTQQMESLVWLGPHKMEMQHAALPELSPGEVLIAVSAAGICGSELSGYLGQNSLRKPPLVMGHEAAGRVAQSTQGTFADGSPARVGTRVTFSKNGVSLCPRIETPCEMRTFLFDKPLTYMLCYR